MQVRFRWQPAARSRISRWWFPECRDRHDLGREGRLAVCLTILLTLLGGCKFEPVSAALESDETAYLVQNTAAGRKLTTRIPIPYGSLSPGAMSFDAPEHVPFEAPPGEASGQWTRQNRWYYPQQWGSFEEYWFGWMLLDVFSIDRGRHTRPVEMQAAGVENLFATFASDHYTRYFTPEKSTWLGEVLSGTGSDSIFGLFFRLWPRDTLVAAWVDSGSAAWVAGMRADDRLLRFDGRWAASSLGYLRDSTGSRAVEFELFRPSEGGIRTLSIRRKPHVMPSVYSDTLPGAVGYISISQFVSTQGIATDALFQKAATWLEANSRGPWILDLRDNGGGAIDAAERTTSALVPDGSELVVYRERRMNDTTLSGYLAVDTSRVIQEVTRRLEGRKIIVLQDSGTASASEILISALRENLGASLVSMGDTSFGKGIGQIYVPTQLDGYMAITCMHIDPLRAPSYHRVGIAPDHLTNYGDSTIAAAWRTALGIAGRSVPGSFAGAVNFAAVDWNRRQIASKPREPLVPPGPGRPFPLR